MALGYTLPSAVLVTSLFILRSYSLELNVSQAQAPTPDHDLVEFLQNFEYLGADQFFLHGATGRGLDAIAPELNQGGPPPLGGKLAALDPFTKDVILQFAWQKRVVDCPRPLLNISKQLFAEFANQAAGQTLSPPFDPYANTLNFLLASYGISEFAPPGYVRISPHLQNATLKTLVAGLLGVEFGQQAVIRAYLYERRNFLVFPYPVTVAEFTNSLSELGNRLGKEGTKSEGLVVPPSEGAEGKVSGNVLSADNDSLSYAKEPAAIVRVAYGRGNEAVPGGFFPRGANGRIARSFLTAAP
ncbi:hypothetical protein CR513_07967, partial [Mucuna pruriens]